MEAKILPQSRQGTEVLGFGTLFFLADLLSSRLCSRLLSKCFVPLRIAALQAGRSWAKACHSSTGMLIVGLEGRFQHIFVPLPLPAFVPFSS